MYQYKAVLKSTKEIIAEGHSVEDIEKQVLHFKRQQKYGLHTHMNDQVEVFHVMQNHVDGQKHKEKLLKLI